MAPERDSQKPRVFQDLLALSEEDRQAMLSAAKPGAATERPRHARLLMDANARVGVEMSNGQGFAGNYIVYPVDIAAAAIVVLHCGFVHAGTRCGFHLRTIDGKTLAATAKAVRCRHIKGRAHEVVCEFETPLDPALFVAPDPAVRKPEVAEPKNAAEFHQTLTAIIRELQAVAQSLLVVNDARGRLNDLAASAQSLLGKR